MLGDIGDQTLNRLTAKIVFESYQETTGLVQSYIYECLWRLAALPLNDDLVLGLVDDMAQLGDNLAVD